MHRNDTHLFFMASARAMDVDSSRSTAMTTSAVVKSWGKLSIWPPGNHQEMVMGGRPVVKNIKGERETVSKRDDCSSTRGDC